MPALSRPANTSPTVSPPVASRRYRRVLFDSSVWIAFFLTTDVFHFKALRIVGNYEKRQYCLLIPVIVLLELITVLSRHGQGIDRIRKIISEIQSTKNYHIITISDEELLELALKHVSQTRLKSMDYTIFLHCVKVGNVKFESFDVKLHKSLTAYRQQYEKK